MTERRFPNPIFCAFDTPDPARVAALATALAGQVGGIKIGLEYFVARGPDGIDAVRSAGLPIFLDLKLHDIPNTVAGAVKSAMHLAPAIMTLHATGGFEMMRRAAEAAAEAAEAAQIARPLLVGVTVLTSLDSGDLEAMGVAGSVADQARRLALLAQKAGLDGIVCSPLEATSMRSELGPEALLVVPGIRPGGMAADDQKRVMGPKEALAAGADVLVIGRPITASDDPAAAARAIMAEIGA